MTTVPVLLAGPTGSGKSAVALRLAPLVRGEIVSADSMQVFRGLDVGTAKPTATERARVPHHLLDVASPSEAFSAAQWLHLATAAEAAIRSRGARPIFCGGTGLYFSAWLNGLDAPAPGDAQIRAELEATPLPVLLEELQLRDPERFAIIDRANPRRVVRAVEIVRVTGAPVRRRRVGAGETAHPPTGRGSLIVLRRDPIDLRRRLEQRVDAMFDAGWVEEVRGLLKAPGGLSRTAAQAIGYRQVAEFLNGTRDLAATVAEVKTRTWQYARRQGTWFRNQFAWAHFVDVREGESAEATAERLRVWLDGSEGPGF